MARNKRKQGDGTMRLRKDGRWEGRIVVEYDENGIPKTKSVLAKTKAECEEKLKALRDKLGKSVERFKPDMPFGQWIDFWYQTDNLHHLCGFMRFIRVKLLFSTFICISIQCFFRFVNCLGNILGSKNVQNSVIFERLRNSFVLP